MTACLCRLRTKPKKQPRILRAAQIAVDEKLPARSAVTANVAPFSFGLLGFTHFKRHVECRRHALAAPD